MRNASRRQSLLDRAGRVAFMFVMMNVWAVAGLLSAVSGKKVWR